MQTVEKQALEHDLDEFQARKNMYLFLHLLFSKPLSTENYMEIHQQENLEGLKELGKGGPLLYDFFSKQEQNDLKNERQEYYRLFIGPGTVLAPPWESVYRGRDKIIYDFPSREMNQLYDRFGLELANKNQEAEDHISLELEFMIYLIEKKLNKDENDFIFVEGQWWMLSKHLSKWIPEFSYDVVSHTKSKFFKGAALLLNEFIIYDYQYMKHLLSDANYPIHT